MVREWQRHLCPLAGHHGVNTGRAKLADNASGHPDHEVIHKSSSVPTRRPPGTDHPRLSLEQIQ
jgi:hypothetical protein